MRLKNIKQLFSALIGLGGLLVALSWLLQRNGFTLKEGTPFDWRGLIFVSLSMMITVIVFELVRRSQKMLRYNYVWYGLIWLIPVIMLTSVSASRINENTPASELAKPAELCQPSILPKICRQDKPGYIISSNGTEAPILAGTTFQAGYLAMFVLYGSLGYVIYCAVRKRIKGHRREDIFQ